MVSMFTHKKQPENNVLAVIKRLNQLWALRNFDALRSLGCKRTENATWELWEEQSGSRALIWSSHNRP
jgi:hypothetical protein